MASRILNTLRNKWINFLYQVATGSKGIRTILTPVGATFFLLFTACFVFLSLNVDQLLEFPELVSEPVNGILSIPILVIGLLLLLWTLLHFVRAKGTPVPFNPPPQLVKTGPYAYCRNPMLTGVFLVLLGLGVYFQSFSLVFIFTPVFILISVLELKAIEEPELAKRLGKAYLDYKKKTPMFVPTMNSKKTGQKSV